MTDTNGSLTEDLPNSVVPTTINGLLAEEWTIDPYSPMPSFLERVFMQEAHDSSYHALETAYDTIVDYAERFVVSLARQRAERFATPQRSTGNLTDEATSRLQALQSQLLDRSRQVAQRFLRIMAHTMRQYRLSLICLCIYTIERASLERSSCLLAESFYGGHRVKLAPRTNNAAARSTAPLDTRDKVRLASLVALSIFCKGKLEQLYRSWKGQAQIFSDDRKLFVMLYPWIRSCLQSVSFVCKWNYLLGFSPFFDVPSLVLQQWLRRVTKDDSPTLPTAATSNSPPASQTPDNNGRLVQRASTAATLGLLVSWITWCRSTWLQMGRDHDKTNVIPPPPPPPPSTLAAKSGRCCLCGARPPDRPTACTVSGFVGCSTCMEDYLQRNSRCPVTQYPCSPDSWVRLYEPRS